jgi:hypothetical protein
MRNCLSALTPCLSCLSSLNIFMIKSYFYFSLICNNYKYLWSTCDISANVYSLYSSNQDNQHVSLSFLYSMYSPLLCCGTLQVTLSIWLGFRYPLSYLPLSSSLTFSTFSNHYSIFRLTVLAFTYERECSIWLASLNIIYSSSIHFAAIFAWIGYKISCHWRQ